MSAKKSELQRSQNGTIRFIHRQERGQQIDIEELHTEYNIKPVNRRMFRRAEIEEKVVGQPTVSGIWQPSIAAL